MAFGTGAVTTAVIGAGVAGGIGLGGSLLTGALGGGGSSSSGVDPAVMAALGKDASKDVQGYAFGTKFAGETQKLKVKKLDDGTFAVVAGRRDGEDYVIKTFDKEKDAKKYGEWAVLDEDGELMEVFDTRNAARTFVDNRRGDPKQADPFIPAVEEAGDKLVGQVGKLVDNIVEEDLSKEQKDLFQKLKKYNEQLLKFNETQDKELVKDFKDLDSDYKEGIKLLNERDKAAFERELSSFEKDAETFVSGFEKDVSRVIASGDDKQKSLIGKYETKSLGLGDSFLKSIDSLTGTFDAETERALDLSPERLSGITQAADFLTKESQKTLFDALSAADPRALELAAIADENAAALMSGRISADTQANVARSSAMRALQGGFGASSGMGRGLTARDLGLTALNLQQQGLSDYERQRRLMYETRVAPALQDPTKILGLDIDARNRAAATKYDAGFRAAVSDRDQRQNVFDTGLLQNLTRVRTNTQDRISAAGTAFNANMDTNRAGFTAQLGERANRTGRTANRLLNSYTQGTSRALNMYTTNVATGRQVNANNVNAAGNVYSTNVDSLWKGAGLEAAAMQNAFTADVNARSSVFGQMSAARSQAASNAANTLLANAQFDAANDTSRTNMWGSLINSGMSLAGAVAGSYNNPLNNYTPTGWGNFDYGSGTGA